MLISAEIATAYESEAVLRSEDIDEASSPKPTPGRRGRKPGSTLKALRARAAAAAEAEALNTFKLKNYEDETFVRQLIDDAVKADSTPPVPSLVQLGKVGAPIRV